VIYAGSLNFSGKEEHNTSMAMYIYKCTVFTDGKKKPTKMIFLGKSPAQGHKDDKGPGASLL